MKRITLPSMWGHFVSLTFHTLSLLAKLPNCLWPRTIHSLLSWKIMWYFAGIPKCLKSFLKGERVSHSEPKLSKIHYLILTADSKRPVHNRLSGITAVSINNSYSLNITWPWVHLACCGSPWTSRKSDDKKTPPALRSQKEGILIEIPQRLE